MIIRDAVYDDIDNIAELYISNWKETYKGLLSEDYLNGLTKDYAVEKWSKYLKNGNQIFVAYEENEFLATAKLTSKGQITIPKIVRETLKLDEGDSVFFYVDKNNNIKISNTKDCKIETDNNKEQIVVKRGNTNE